MNQNITIQFTTEELEVIEYALKTLPINALTSQQMRLRDGLLMTIGFGNLDNGVRTDGFAR